MQIDLIDVAHIEKGSPVEAEIAQTGVVIYEKNKIIQNDLPVLKEGLEKIV